MGKGGSAGLDGGRLKGLRSLGWDGSMCLCQSSPVKRRVERVCGESLWREFVKMVSEERTPSEAQGECE